MRRTVAMYTRKKILIIILIILGANLFCSCSKKRVVEEDVSSYIIGDTFIYLLSEVEVIREEMPHAYNNLKSGKYEAAGLDFLEKVKEVEKTHESDQTQFYIWNNVLAISYDLMDETERANDILVKTIQSAEADGADVEILVSLYNNKGIMENHMAGLNPESSIADAQSYFSNALKYARDYGTDQYKEMIIRTNTSLIQAGNIDEVNSAKWDQVETEMLNLIDQEQKIIGLPRIVSIYNYRNLGTIYRYQEKYKKSEKSHKKALQLCEKMPDLGVDINRIKGITIAELAQTYYKWGKFEEAIAEYDTVFKIYEKYNPPLKRQLRKYYINRGLTYDLSELYEEGMACHEQALRLSKPYSRDRGIIHMNMAANYFARGMYEECVPLELKAYKVMIDYNQPIQEDVRWSLEAIYHRVTDVPEQIETSFEEWLEKKMEELEDE